MNPWLIGLGLFALRVMILADGRPRKRGPTRSDYVRAFKRAYKRRTKHTITFTYIDEGPRKLANGLTEVVFVARSSAMSKLLPAQRVRATFDGLKLVNLDG